MLKHSRRAAVSVYRSQIRVLAKVGLVAIDRKGVVHWPFYIAPWEMWKMYFLNPEWSHSHCKAIGGWFAFFRNSPGVIKWIPGRLLPRRWGFRIIGFEFGDRGALGGTDVVQ